MRHTVSGLFFLSLFLVLELAIGNRRNCEEKHCVQSSQCPSFLKEMKRWKEMQVAGNTEAANELLKKLNGMACDRRTGKVCCLEDMFDTGVGAVDERSKGAGLCGSHILGFVSGQQFPDPNSNYQMAGMYCDNSPENRWSGFWLAPEKFHGQGFIAILDSDGPFKGIKLRNTHNNVGWNRATKLFSLFIGNSPKGPWKRIISDQVLEPIRKPTAPQITPFYFDRHENITGRYIRFDVNEFYGHGAGLQYFDICTSYEECVFKNTGTSRGLLEATKIAIDN